MSLPIVRLFTFSLGPTLRKLFSLFFLFVVFTSTIAAQNYQFEDCIPKTPALSEGMVVQSGTNFFSPEEEDRLEKRLRAYMDSSSVEIAIIVHPNFCDNVPHDFAHKILNQWGVGDAEKDNGLVIAIKPKTESLRGELYIAPGYGLQKTMTSYNLMDVVDYHIIPLFKEGKFFEGVDRGLDQIILLNRGEYENKEDRAKKLNRKFWRIFLLAFLFFGLLIFLMIKFGGSGIGGGGTTYSGGGYSTGSFGSGGGFSSGGGFGGFGGGSSGGGGAGGSW